MVNHASETLDEVFSALASPIRRGMLERLSQGWASVGELSEPYDVSPPAISKHLRILESAGLIERQKIGRVNYCRLIVEPMENAAGWFNFYRQFWGNQFDSLAEFLAEEQDE
ncbi:MAG: metalloregulator ArsR/SmtB family transcription factor [Anaerolineales bacterium]|nr:metalloregulator ArsR/SmtB family transcription factor [Anaerolineales bacterium]